MSDRASIYDRIVAGDGKVALSFDEWLRFTHAVEDDGVHDFVVEYHAKKLGMKPAELLAAADRTSVYLEAKVHRQQGFEITGYIFEIKDAAPAPTVN